MVNNRYVRGRYVRGIAFAVLLSVVLIYGAAAVPTITITAPPSNGTSINGTFSFVANVINTNENLNAVYFNFTNVSGWSLNSGNLVSTPANTSSAGTNFNYPLNTQTLADFNYTLTVNATNENLNSETATRTFIIDNTPPPAVTIVSANAGQTYINWTWIAPSVADFYKVLIYIDTVYVTFISHTPGSSQSYNGTFASNTSHNISLLSVDTTGNVNSTSATNTSSTLPNTPTGQVTLTSSNLVIIFSNVTSSGTTTITENSAFASYDSSLFTNVGKFYTVTTTAGLGGNNATIGLTYTGLVPSGYSASDLRLYRYDGTSWANITNTRDDSKVYGNVTTFSTFVLGVPPKPSITKVDPTGTSLETIGRTAQTFRIKVDQAVSVIWYVNSDPKNNSGGIVPAGVEINFPYTPPTSGNYNVSVNANNATTGLSSTVYWNWTVRPRSYAAGNRIWDAGKPDQFSLTYTWNPMSFPGFYYDIDSDVGNESITIKLNSYTDRTIREGNIIYDTTPEEVNFGYTGFGSYQVIGFMADKYFAGYTANSTPPKPTVNVGAKSALGSGQLHKVLIDDDTKRTISVGSTLTLQEGYVLKAKDISTTDRIMLISLLKDGNEVDTATLEAGQTYVYAPSRVGSVTDLPIIIVRFDSVFSGREVQAAFLKGLFQISQNPTTVKSGDQFNDMKVRSVGQNKIEMSTDSDISLNKGNTEDLMGDVKIIVADNDTLRFALSVEKTGTFEVRSTVYRDSDPIDLWNPYNFGMNIGKTSIGFYYDLDDGIGNESLRLVSLSGRTISSRNLVYTTTPEIVNFGYSGFGSYQVIGFMAEKYFAGYTSSSIPATAKPIITVGAKSALASGQLHKVLIDDDTKRTISVGSTLTLQEGYVLKAKDISVADRIMLISLLKDGNEVDTATLEAGQTYIYVKRVGSVSDLPIIIVRFDSVFSGREVQAAFLRGVFQISENPTTIKTSDQYKDMKVRSVGQDKIEMSNEGDISLDNGRIEELMGIIKLKVGDTAAADNQLRFYFAVDVTPEMVANQLVIDAPAKANAGDTINVKVTAGGKAADGASVSIGSNAIGTTDANGLLNYTLLRTMKGVQNITATKLGYQQATRSIEVLEFVDYRLSIDAPVNANQFLPINIKVTYNGSAIGGAAVGYDNASIGTTDNNGMLNYTPQTSGTHTISASKSGYITAVRDINIRAPYSEYKALDINITPNMVFTNEQALIRSNITNVGTKADTLPVELISNGTAVDNRSVSLAPGEIKEINFTRKETLPGNYTIEILGQKGLLEVKEAPLNLLLIGGIATGFGAIIIYLLTAKSKMSLEMLRQKLLGKFGKTAEKAVKVVTPPKQ